MVGVKKSPQPKKTKPGVKKRLLPGTKEARGLRSGVKKFFVKIESNRIRALRRKEATRSFREGNTRKISLIQQNDLILIFNLYEKYITNRFLILGSKEIVSGRSDDVLNSLYVDKMAKIFQGEQFGEADFYSGLKQLLNKLCNIGRVLNVLLRSYYQNKQNTFRGYVQSMSNYGIPANVASSYYQFIPGMRQAAANSSIGAFNTNLNFSHLKPNTSSVSLLNYAVRLASFFEAFKETNDVVSLLTNLIKTQKNVNSQQYKQKVADILHINLSKIGNRNQTDFNLAIRIIGSLRSPSPDFYPIPMLPPPFKGNRHHIVPIASLPNMVKASPGAFMKTSESKISLNLALVFLDCLAMERTFPRGQFLGNVKSVAIRGLLDKAIPRQEPALLKSVRYLSSYMPEINDVYTSARHGSIHTQSTASGFNAFRGRLGMNVLVDPVTGIRTRLTTAYAKDVANLELEMYTLLDISKYQPVTFDNAGNLILLTDDLVIQDNSLVDRRYFFQHFLYIFNVNTMPRSEVDILKSFYLSRNSGVNRAAASKKFCIQTTQKNMDFLLSYIYDASITRVLSRPVFISIVQLYYNTISTKENKGFSKLNTRQQNELLEQMQLLFDGQISYDQLQSYITGTWKFLGLLPS